MYIKIVGFKNHIDAEFTFENGKMSLLRGASGSGKTTIFQAMFWALYGNMRNIYNNLNITKNLSVTLVLENMIIFRKKNPELLTVKIDNSLYEDQVAQNIINTNFGSRELWKACSYITQKSRCSLLEGTNKERMQILNFLSFNGENPKDYILKISDKLKEITTKFNLGQATYLSEIELFTKQLEENPVKILMKDTEIKKSEEQLIFLEKQEKEFHSKVLEQERILGTRQYLIDTNNKLKKDLEVLKKKKFLDFPNFKENPKPVLEEIEIPSHLYLVTSTPNLDENSIISYSEYTKEKNKFKNVGTKKEIEKELKELEKIEKVEIKEKITESEIWQVSKNEKDRIQNLTECQKLGINYEENIIKENLVSLQNTLESLLNLEKNLPNYNNLLEIERKLENSLENLENTLENSLENSENLLREKSLFISELKKGLELVSCPNCSVSLRYRNGNLTLGERDPVSISDIKRAEQEYEEISKQYSKAKEIASLKQKASLLSNSFNREEMEKFDKKKIIPLKNLISKISNIKYIEEPEMSSDELTKILKYQKACERKIKLLEELKIREKLDILENRYKLEQERVAKNQELTKEYQKKESERLSKLNFYENQKKTNLSKYEKYKESEEKRYREYILEKNRYENEQKQVLNNISNFEKRIQENILEIENCKIDEKCKEKYENIIIEIKELKNKIEESKYGNTVKKKSEDLEKKRNSLIELQNDMINLDRLKVKAIEVECKQLEDTVNNINMNLEYTLPFFFPEPISLKLLLYKKVKTGDRIKPGLNLEIGYKGMKYDNIDSLSGGEGDRISLALLLALNSVSNSSIILLDECVSSLDGNLKEGCISAIKSLHNKTIICIDHDDTLEGYYNSIIEI